jgi:hypothetical protein
MVRVGIVAEGRTDWLVLEQIMKNVHADIEFDYFQPDLTLLSGIGNGWRGVKAWCSEYGPRLELLRLGLLGKPLDLLIVHADCSMADKVGAERPCPPASDTALALGEVITTSWLNRIPLPDFVVIATPSKSSEAWVIATLDPPYSNLADLECDKGAEDELVRRKLLQGKVGRRVKKSIPVYAPLADRIGQSIDLVCTHCPQAEAFRSNFQAAVARTSPPPVP